MNKCACLTQKMKQNCGDMHTESYDLNTSAPVVSLTMQLCLRSSGGNQSNGGTRSSNANAFQSSLPKQCVAAAKM